MKISVNILVKEADEVVIINTNSYTLKTSPITLPLPFQPCLSTFKLNMTVTLNGTVCCFFSSLKARKVTMVTVTSPLSAVLLCLFRLKAIFQCQTGLCALSLYGAGRVKCEPFVCFQIDPFLWQTALDGTWLFNLSNAAATCERVYGSVEAWYDTQTAERLLDTTAGSCFSLTDTVGLQEAWCFKGGTIMRVSVCACSALWHKPH